MTDNLPPQLYGIWIPHQGWWKLPKPDSTLAAYAEVRRGTAEFYARKVGHGARVQPIDKQLELGNEYLLGIEKERDEQRWSNRFARWIKERK